MGVCAGFSRTPKKSAVARPARFSGICPRFPAPCLMGGDFCIKAVTRYTLLADVNKFASDSEHYSGKFYFTPIYSQENFLSPLGNPATILSVFMLLPFRERYK